MFVLVAFADPEVAKGIEGGFQAAPSCRGVHLATIRAAMMNEPPRFERLPDVIIAESEVMVGGASASLRGLVTETDIPTFLLTKASKMRQQDRAVAMEGRAMFVDRERVMDDTTTFAASIVTYLQVRPPPMAA